MSRRLKILTGAGIVLGLAIFIPVIHHYQLRAATEAYIAELKAQGEPLELAQVIPLPVLPGKNGAPLITNALAQLYASPNATNWVVGNNEPYGMNQLIPGKEMAGWHEPVIHSADTWPHDLTNTWDEADAQLAARQNDLDALRSLIERPTLDFRMDYSDIRDLGLPFHLAQLKLAVQWLEASEYYSLHQDKTAEAGTDVRAMLALIKGLTQEHYEISQLVRLALIRMSAYATWNILQATNVSDESLAHLQADWVSLELTKPLRESFLFERVNELRMFDGFRQSPTNLPLWLGSIFMQKGYDYEQVGEGASARWVFVDKSSRLKKLMNKISIPWVEAKWRWFWSYDDQVHSLQIWGVVLDGARQLETNHSFLSTQAFVETNFVRLNADSLTNYPFEIAAYNTASQLRTIQHAARAEVAKNIVVTAVALKRYELRQQQLPESLAELVPDFLKAVPTDYVNGQPLRYRPNADGTFLLYSVGANGKDDGGNPALEKAAEASNYYDWQQDNVLDWVWPQPATEEEIQNYYAHPPK